MPDAEFNEVFARLPSDRDRALVAFYVSTGARASKLLSAVQGGVHPDLRLRATARLIEIGFDGYAVGGLAVGEGQATMFAVLDATVPALPEDRPRYLMGVGKPADLVGAVLRGIDPTCAVGK